MHLDFSLSEITSLFGQSTDLHQTLAQQISSAKVKSPNVYETKCTA